MIKYRYFVGRVLVYGLISVTVMLSAAVTGCNNKNNISEGSIKTEGSTKTEGNNQSEEFSETDVNDQPSDIDVEPPVIHGISDKTYYIGSKVSYMTDVYMQQISQGRRLMLRLINHRLILHSREVILFIIKQ